MTTSIDGFDSFPFTDAGETRTVFVRGQGPGVVVIHEIPGITPEVAGFARRVADDGFRVYLPHLFGSPGRRFSAPYMIEQLARACVAREFWLLARRASSPVTRWLRALCRYAHGECGGPGVGAIGMCITGNFALSLMVDPSVMAPVLSQPSLPLPVSASHRAALHLSDEDLVQVRERAQGGCKVLGLRFTSDALCPPERFATLRRELGDGFEGVEVDSGPGNPYGISRAAHSVVTRDLVDEAGHPTQVALERVLDLFRERLRP